MSVVENPQGAAGGTAVGHVAGLCAVMLTRLHAVPHWVAVVMFAVAQKFRQGCVKVLLSPHGALTAGGAVHGAGRYGSMRSRVQKVGQVLLNSTSNCTQYRKHGWVRVELS